MASRFLLPDHVARSNGEGAPLPLESARGKLLLVTLGIERIVESESLEVTVWGSADGRRERGWKQLGSFPPKFYCGTYSMTLDLKRHPEVAYLRAAWKMSRWSRAGDPLFGFFLFTEELLMQSAGAA